MFAEDKREFTKFAKVTRCFGFHLSLWQNRPDVKLLCTSYFSSKTVSLVERNSSTLNMCNHQAYTQSTIQLYSLKLKTECIHANELFCKFFQNGNVNCGQNKTVVWIITQNSLLCLKILQGRKATEIFLMLELHSFRDERAAYLCALPWRELGVLEHVVLSFWISAIAWWVLLFLSWV